MLIDKVLSSDKSNGHWFEGDWLHSKRDALYSNRKVDDSRLKHVIHNMEIKTLAMELRRLAVKRKALCGAMDHRLKISHSAKYECGFGQLQRNAYTIEV